MASTRYRTKLCRNFALGHCPQGENCKYIHSMNIPTAPTLSQLSSMYTPMRAAPLVEPRFAYMYPNPPSLMWTGSPPSFPGAQVGGGYAWSAPTYPSVSTSSPTAVQPPQFRPLSWRTTLCRHYVKNQGWCPLGDECGYIHDLNLAAHAEEDVRFPGGQLSASDPRRGRAGTKHSHCWAYVQGLCRVRDCPYLHPVAVNLFIPHTPCLAWPNCTRGVLCNYKHPEPLVPKVARFAPVPAPPQAQLPTAMTVVPSGTVQFHGTTYFPVGMPQGPHAPAPPASTVSSPQNAWKYSPTAINPASGYSPYSTDTAPYHSPYYETVSVLPHGHPSGVPRAFMDPDPLSGGGLHSLPMLLPPGTVLQEQPDAEAHIQAPGDGAAQAAVEAESLTAAQAQGHEAAVDAEGEGEEEFPYRPRVGQRTGHARRVSVTLKSKEDSDAFQEVRTGGAQMQGAPGRRQSWMGHRQRNDPAHRSWPRVPDSFYSDLQGSSAL